MYLDPARYRQGWGSRLMAAAFDDLRAAGFTEASLWVMTANDAARAFYEQAGWEADGAETDHCVGIEIPAVRYERRSSQRSTARSRSRSRSTARPIAMPTSPTRRLRASPRCPDTGSSTRHGARLRFVPPERDLPGRRRPPSGSRPRGRAIGALPARVTCRSTPAAAPARCRGRAGMPCAGRSGSLRCDRRRPPPARERLPDYPLLVVPAAGALRAGGRQDDGSAGADDPGGRRHGLLGLVDVDVLGVAARRCDDQPVFLSHRNLAELPREWSTRFHHGNRVTGQRLDDVPSLVEDRIQRQVDADQAADLFDVLPRRVARRRCRSVSRDGPSTCDWR